MRRLAAAVVLFFLLAVPAAGAWTWPVSGPVLTPFTFDPARPYAGGEHRGVDIGADAGTVVVAPVDGTVTFAGTVPASGKSLSILTVDALSVTLTHLGSLTVAKGEAVNEGAAIGTVGPSGTPEVDVPYLHLGVRRSDDDNGYLDPLALLPAPAPAPLPPPPAPAPATTPADTVPVPTTPTDPAPVPAPPAQTAPVAQTPPPVEVTPVVAPPVETPPLVAPPPAAPPVAAPPVAAPPVGAPPVGAPPVDAPPVVATPAPAAPGGGPEPVRAASPAAVAVPAPAPPAAPDFDPAAPTTFAEPAPAPAQVSSASPRTRAAAQATGRGAIGERTPPPKPHAGRHVATAPHAHPHDLQAAAATASIRRSLPVPRDAARAPRHRPSLPLVLIGAGAAALGALLVLARMLLLPSATREGASSAREDPGCAGLAVRERPPAHRPRGGLRRAGRRVRALSPVEGRRRPHGERHGRARDARDGVRGPRGRVAA